MGKHLGTHLQICCKNMQAGGLLVVLNKLKMVLWLLLMGD